MATFIGVVGTLVTVCVGISKYVDEKENERTAAYRDALYRIFSADINDNNPYIIAPMLVLWPPHIFFGVFAQVSGILLVLAHLDY